MKQFTVRWISVADCLPPPDKETLATQPGWTESELVWAWGDKSSFGDEMFLAYYNHADQTWYDVNVNDFHTSCPVDFWHPMPKPPQGRAWLLYPSQVVQIKTFKEKLSSWLARLTGTQVVR